MEHRIKIITKQDRWFFILILLSILGWLGLVYWASSFDYLLAHSLVKFKASGWVDFANRSIFEGEELGLTDISVIALIVILVSLPLSRYGIISIHEKHRWNIHRILGFAVVFGVLTHWLKGVFSRLRPFQLDAVSKNIDFFDTTNFDFTGWGHASFPSGHTSLVLILIAFLRFIPESAMRFVFMSFTLTLSLWVALARVASESHWFSDTFASISLGCLLLFMLEIPFFGRATKFSIKSFWKYCLLTLVGLMLFFLGFSWVESTNQMAYKLSLVLATLMVSWLVFNQIFSLLKVSDR